VHSNMSFKTTVQIIEALKAKLEVMAFTDEALPAFAGKLIFDAINFYDIPRLEQALKDLLQYKNRICLIVPGIERFENETKGSILETKKYQDFLLIISDRDYTPGKGSHFGDDTHPGVLLMKDTVLDELLGKSLDFGDVIIEPSDGESIRVAESDKALSKSREGYRLLFRIQMGIQQTQLQRGRSLRR